MLTLNILHLVLLFQFLTLSILCGQELRKCSLLLSSTKITITGKTVKCFTQITSKFSFKMSASKPEEEKCCVIEVIKDAGYVSKLCYITVLYYCGSSHWRCSGLDFNFQSCSRSNLKIYKYIVVKLPMFSVLSPMYFLIYS